MEAKKLTEQEKITLKDVMDFNNKLMLSVHNWINETLKCPNCYKPEMYPIGKRSGEIVVHMEGPYYGHCDVCGTIITKTE